MAVTNHTDEYMQTEKNIAEPDSHRTTIIVVAIIAALVIGGLFYVLMRKSVAGGSPQPRLAGALRPGNPDFDKYLPQIVLDQPEAEQATSVLGGLEMTLHTTARNFTGRTITGLEIRGAVIDHQGQPVKERSVVVVPDKSTDELAPNKTLSVLVRLQGFRESDDRAKIKMEVSGVTFR